MRYLRLLWTLIKAACGNRKALATLRYGMATLSAIDAVMKPYRRGDYQAALDATDGFRQDGEVTASYCFYRGSALAHLGRLPEAEIWLRRNIAMRQPDEKRRLSIGYTTLGRLLLQMGRCDDAIECFEASIRHFPERSSGYRCMAEACLLQRCAPSQPVEWARLAIEKAHADKISAELVKLNLGEASATMAWATAVASHNPREVARLVSDAVAAVGSTTVSSTAQVHYQSARAFEELADAAQSAHHYQLAAELDRQGEWGRAARAAMTSPVAP